jgi:hypothetical protein
VSRYYRIDLESMPNKKLRKVASWSGVQDVGTKERETLICEVLQAQVRVPEPLEVERSSAAS